MPIAKYKRDEKAGLYYTYEKTGFFNADGTQKYKKIRAKTIKLLDEKVKAFREQSAFNVEPTRITVDEWFNKWLVSYKSGCRESTRSYYSYAYKNHIKPAVGGARLNAVREVHLQRILSDMSEKYSVKTVSGVRVTLHSMFETARDNRLIQASPAQHLKVSGKEPKKRRALTNEERKAYLAACKSHDFGVFAAFLYFFGLRRGEALALLGSDISKTQVSVTKQHVFGDSNIAKVLRPKTKAGVRDIPIPDKARDYIDFSAFPDGLLFTGRNGNALSHQEIYDRWKSFIRNALGEGTDVTEHVLRHNYCTMLFESGVDVMTAKRLMGHEDVQTTMGIYAHYTSEMEKRNTDKVLSIG